MCVQIYYVYSVLNQETHVVMFLVTTTERQQECMLLSVVSRQDLESFEMNKVSMLGLTSWIIEVIFSVRQFRQI